MPLRAGDGPDTGFSDPETLETSSDEVLDSLPPLVPVVDDELWPLLPPDAVTLVVPPAVVPPVVVPPVVVSVLPVPDAVEAVASVVDGFLAGFFGGGLGTDVGADVGPKVVAKRYKKK